MPCGASESQRKEEAGRRIPLESNNSETLCELRGFIIKFGEGKKRGLQQSAVKKCADLRNLG